MADKPNKWIALVLGLFVQPLGMLYAGAPWLALPALLIPLVIAILPGLVSGVSTSFLGFALLVFYLACGALAFWLASRIPAGATRRWYSRWYGMLGVTAAFVVLALSTRIFVVEPYRFPTSSMEPTMKAGSLLLVQKWGYGDLQTLGIRLGRTARTAPIARADLLVFRPPVSDDPFVKRVVGLPGDLVVVRSDGVEVNGVPTRRRKLGEYLLDELSEPYSRFAERLGEKDFEVLQSPRGQMPGLTEDFPSVPGCTGNRYEVRCKVPAGRYFVMGDNRDNSMDSRVFGTIAESDIVGKVVGVVAPRQASVSD